MFSKEILIPFLFSIKKFETNYAFCIDDHFYTYYDLAKAISKIRLAIKRKHFSGKIIGLIANDDLETYAAIFAIWMEGCAYVPLHPSLPVSRLLEIISQSEINLLISSNLLKPQNYIEMIDSSLLSYEEIYLEPKLVDDEELAYILYTSGSTGKPKGVQITRKNISAFIKSFWKTGVNINENDKCLQCFDLTFDVSVQSFLIPLLRGACTYTVPPDKIKYSYIYGLFEYHALTFGALAPSMLRLLQPYFEEIYVPSMKYNIITAEASPVDLINEWSKCIPNSEIYNFYGPTEATIYCTYYKFKRGEKNKEINGMLTIGKFMQGVEGIIINDKYKKLKPNVKGELCICGDQLTPGYLNDQKKNLISFFNKYHKGKSRRFYKTGDFGFYDGEGEIMLIGRLDHQVKIQGYRIELGEIEYHTRNYLNGKNVAAIAFKNDIGLSEIAIFIEGTHCEETDLRNYLSTKIPFYMIPSKIVNIKSFPLNANEKTDRIKLAQFLNEN